MLVQEIKEKLSGSEIVHLESIINFKSYLPFIEKKLLCDSIVEASLEQNENGLMVCDYYNKELSKNIGIIVNFTDIELGEEFLQDYDILCELEVVDYVLNNMNQSDRCFIENMVDKNIEQEMKINNSLENIIANKLDKAIEKLPTNKEIRRIMNDIPKAINKIDPTNLEILKGIIGNQSEGEEIGR